MPKLKPLPTRIRRLVAMCEEGQVVCHSLRHSDVGDEHQYWLEPSGKNVGEWTVKKATELGLIVPTGDGLFAEDSQTYRLASA